jgi:hypothetical protein
LSLDCNLALPRPPPLDPLTRASILPLPRPPPPSLRAAPTWHELGKKQDVALSGEATARIAQVDCTQ